MSATDLPGLDRLLDVVSKHGVPIETLPADRFPPLAGAEVCGLSTDPLLAAAFARFGKIVLGRVGLELWLIMPGDGEKNGLILESEEWQGYFPHRFWPEHFRALVPFGGEGLYRYATVPELVNPEGFQPVVFLDSYEDIYALPIASNVNRFFDTFSRYLEIMVADPDYQVGRAPRVGFPYGIPELIAKDKPLVGMIKEGRFDRLMYERNKTGLRNERAIASTREWIHRILQ